MRALNILIITAAAIAASVSQFTINGDLTISLSETTIQEQSHYTFSILLIFNDPITVGSLIEIRLPDQYPSTPATSYACDVLDWPFMGTSLSCSLTNRVLVVTGGFPVEFEVVEDTTFEFVVYEMTNPDYAGSTGDFMGKIKSSNSTTIVDFNTATVQINTGDIDIELRVSPDTVNTLADLIITATPQHEIPADGWMQIQLPTNRWPRSISTNADTIFNSTPSCQRVSNAPTNLYCDYTQSTFYVLLKVYNIKNVTSNSSTFSFKVSSIVNPPTTQPQGLFSFTILSPSSQQTDQSANHKVTASTPASIMSPSLSLSSYMNSAEVEAIISIRITSKLETSDSIFILLPDQVNMDSLTKITAKNTQIATFERTLNLIHFNGIAIETSIPFEIILQNITNPDYVVTTGSFSIYTKRNNYLIDEIDNAFNYTTVSGDINGTLSTSNSESGQASSYTLTIQTQHSISNLHYFLIAFPSDSFAIPPNHTLTCQSNLAPSCTVEVISGNTAKISQFISASNANTYNDVRLTVELIDNPAAVGFFTSLQVSMYTGEGYLVDREEEGFHFQVGARELSTSQITISSTSGIVYRTVELTLEINTYNSISTDAYIHLQIPSEFMTASISCSPFCTLISASLYIIEVDSSSLSNSATTLTLNLQNLRNPKSTAYTESFQIKIYDNADQLLYYVTSGLQYRCTAPATAGITLDRNSTQNSKSSTAYTFTASISFQYTGTIGMKVHFPTAIQCSGCLVDDSNSTHYMVLIEPLQFSNTTYKTITTTLTGLKNSASYEPQTVELTILSSDYISEIAYGEVSVENQSPSALTYSHSFSVRRYLETTVFTVSSLAPTSNSFSYLLIQFGVQFNLAGAVLASGTSSYSLSFQGANVVKLTKLVVAVNGFAISGILCPEFSPSTPITFSTYSSADYLMSSASEVSWAIACTHPCRECSTDLSYCLSCYEIESLVQSRVLLHNNTCISGCPSTFYHETATNSCLACSSSCLECTQSSTTCTSCPEGSVPYLLSSNSTCYSECPDGYYESASTSPKRCLHCDTQNKHCETCSSFLECDSCQDGYYYYLAQCYSTCPADLTVANQYNNICEYCPQNCSKCVRDSSLANGTFGIKCTECENGFLLDQGGCYDSCRTVGFVPYDDTCQPCHSSCLTCSQNIYNCLTCNITTSSRYFLTNACLISCPNGYYTQDALNLCLPCTAPCEYCSSSSVSTCTSCIHGYSLFFSVCEGACPQEFFENGSVCSDCPSPCLTCSSYDVCSTCESNYSLYANAECLAECPDSYVSVNQICMECSSNCKTCSLVNYCSSCFNGSYLLNGACLDPCPSKYYPFQSGEVSSCMACPYECSECISDVLCNDCIAGYELEVSNATCVSICQSGSVPIEGICEQCNTGCRECIYIQANCSACHTNYYFHNIISEGLGDTNICYETCPSHLHYYNVSMSCLTQCPSDTYSNDLTEKECLDCPAFCSGCISDAECTSCVDGASMFNDLCYAECPNDYPYVIGGACRSCNVVECYECQSTQCIQCNSEFLLISASNICIRTCGSGMAYNTTTKECIQISSTNSTTTSTTDSTSAALDLNFVPLPYAIAGILVTVVVVALHFTNYVSIIGIMFGVVSVLLMLAAWTSVGVGVSAYYKQLREFNDNSSQRLLQESEGAPSLYSGIVVILVALIISLGLNIGTFVVYMCVVRIRRYRIVLIVSLILGLKVIGAALCSNICSINMKIKISSFIQHIFNAMAMRRTKKSFITQKRAKTPDGKDVSIEDHQADEDTLPVEFDQQEQEQVRQEYGKFWRSYDKIVFASIFVSAIPLIVGGGMLAFKYAVSQFLFYGGVEIIVLGTIDLIMSIVWQFWKHRPILQDDLSSASMEKMYHPEDSMEKIGRDQQVEDLIKEQIPRTRTAQLHRSLDANDEALIPDHFEKDFRSEFARAKDVMRLKNEQIEQAIHKGVFRRNQLSLAEQQHKEDELSDLDSAEKMNHRQKKDGFGDEEDEDGIQAEPALLVFNEEDNQEEDKNYNGIIFQDLNEENLDTHPEEDQDQQEKPTYAKISQQKKRKSPILKSDSLGSLKVVNVIPTHDTRNPHETSAQVQKTEKTEIKEKKSLLIEDIEENDQTPIKNAKQIKLELRNKKDNEEGRLVNIFQQEENEDEVAMERKKNPFIVMRSAEISPEDRKKQIFQDSRYRDQNRVIYADLESIGTVSGGSDDEGEEEGEGEGEGEQPKQLFSIQRKDDEYQNDDFTKPSSFIQANFKYKHKPKEEPFSMPQKIKPKKAKGTKKR